MSDSAVLFLIQLLGYVGFLWLGLYILSRGDSGKVAALTGITALLTACFFLFSALTRRIPDLDALRAVDRAGWWSAVLPPALWLHLSLRLNPGAVRLTLRQPAIAMAYGAAALITLLGLSTDLLRNYHDRAATLDVPTPAGPLYGLYVAFLLGCAGFATLNLLRMTRHPHHNAQGVPGTRAQSPDGAEATAAGGSLPSSADETRFLAVGAIFFLLGVAYISINILMRAYWSEIPAYILILSGLTAVAATVMIHSSLLLGTDVRRDALYSMVGLATLLVPYLLASWLLVGFNDLRHVLLTAIVATLITAPYTLRDRGRAWLDAAFFTPVVREEREAARAYVAALATPPAGPHPDLSTVKQFDDAVRRALTHLSDPTKLATSPLLNLGVVGRAVADGATEDNRLNRAAALKEILLELLEGLRPSDGPGGITGDPWRYYNCLYYPYVRGIGRRRAPTVLRQLQERRQRDGTPRTDLERVADWLLQVDEDTFYKWQRRGSDTIAAALREREQAAGGVVPAAGARPAVEFAAQVAVAAAAL